MAEFLTTSGTSHHLENIIIEADRILILVSPYLQISKTLLERLKNASNKRVSIKIIYGKDDLKPKEMTSLTSLRNIELFYFENLHAKCYFNESKMIITSMNKYEFSERTNREMGVLIDAAQDKTLYEKASAEALSILQSAVPINLNNGFRLTEKTNSYKPQPKKNHQGFCIRCENSIRYNLDSPYCSDCYSSWKH